MSLPADEAHSAETLCQGVSGEKLRLLLRDDVDETDRPLSEQARADLRFTRLIDDHDEKMKKYHDHNDDIHHTNGHTIPSMPFGLKNAVQRKLHSRQGRVTKAAIWKYRVLQILLQGLQR